MNINILEELLNDANDAVDQRNHLNELMVAIYALDFEGRHLVYVISKGQTIDASKWIDSADEWLSHIDALINIQEGEEMRQILQWQRQIIGGRLGEVRWWVKNG